MEAITLLSLMTLPSKLLAVVKAAKARDWNLVVSTLGLWVLTIGVLVLAANADVFESWVISDQFPALGVMNFASLTLLGLILGSGMAKIYDLQKAFDSSDSAREPRLLGPGSGPTT